MRDTADICLTQSLSPLEKPNKKFVFAKKLHSSLEYKGFF